MVSAACALYSGSNAEGGVGVFRYDQRVKHFEPFQGDWARDNGALAINVLW